MHIDKNAPGNKSQQEVTRTTDNETGPDPTPRAREIPLAPHANALLEKERPDVDAADAVASQHLDA